MEQTFDEIVSALIDLNKKYREAFKDYKPTLSPIDYAKHYCTVSCDMGRGVGKTKYITSHATKEDLVITFSYKFKHIMYGANPEYDVITIAEIFMIKGKNSYNTIYIDEPALTFRDGYHLEDVYREFVDPTKEQTFVLLGRQ
jgi:hypothetical protein